MITYKEKPVKNDASMWAWNYVVATYGEPLYITFSAPCGGRAIWTAVVNGKIITITPKEIRGFIENWEKIKFESTKGKPKI